MKGPGKARLGFLGGDFWGCSHFKKSTLTSLLLSKTCFKRSKCCCMQWKMSLLRTLQTKSSQKENNNSLLHLLPLWKARYLLGGSSQLESGYSPLFISHLGHLEGERPYLADLLTMAINHLLSGMILEANNPPFDFFRDCCQNLPATC